MITRRVFDCLITNVADNQMMIENAIILYAFIQLEANTFSTQATGSGTQLLLLISSCHSDTMP